MHTRLNHRYSIVLVTILLQVALGSCFRNREISFMDVTENRPERVSDLELIRQKGVLTVVTE